MSRLVEALHSGRVLVMDGAMGTELQRLGLRDDECSAMWNLTHPEAVCAVHCAYLEEGAEILVTNTFQAHKDGMDRYDLWQAAIIHAQTFRPLAPMVLADIGPTEGLSMGSYLWLLGFCQGVDGLLLETWTIRQAGLHFFVRYNRAGCGMHLPVLISFAYRKADGPAAIARQAMASARYATGLGGVAVGANCGVDIDMDDLLEIVRVYREHTDLPLFVRPNAGTPKRTASGWEYPRSPEYMADKLWPLLEAGVTMVGGCCGTTPVHIAAFRRVVDEWNAKRAVGR